MAGKEDKTKKPTITVAGVTFSADQVTTATININGRAIHIYEPKKKKKKKKSIGFK